MISDNIKDSFQHIPDGALITAGVMAPVWMQYCTTYGNFLLLIVGLVAGYYKLRLWRSEWVDRRAFKERLRNERGQLGEE